MILGAPPAPCVNIWGFPTWDHFNGIAGDDVYRQYLAEVSYSETRHTLSVTVETRNESDLIVVAPLVEELLENVPLTAVTG